MDWVDKGCPQQPTTGHPMTNRAQSNLFELPRCEEGNQKVTFRASIHTAYRDRKIKENPNGFLERIETIPTDKEHLSQDEVIRLASTPCSAPALKRAFLFSCLTALRKSDIKKLNWEEIQPYGSDGVMYTPIRDKIAISCMLRQIPEFSSHAIRHGLYIKNRKRLFCP